MKMTFERFQKRLPLLLLAGALAVVSTTLAFASRTTTKTKAGPVAVNVPLDETAVPRNCPPCESFAPIVNKVAPAVVKIETTMRLKASATPQWPGIDNPFWRHFFGDHFGQAFPPHPLGHEYEFGLGSGVIVTSNGYILTNNHVVDHASEVKVTLHDGREFTAKVIGRDPESDIAVVKIDAHNLPVAHMADSSKVEVGDVVLAIGDPFGVGQTVTMGIVSAKDRGNMGIEDYEDFIQTDAAINPGNSGGPLVDTEGRIIGINTAILSRSGGNQGIGFAIPSDLARHVMESLIKYGHVTRGYLGLMIQNVTPALAQEFKLKEPTGALVGEVEPKGPAAKAGFKDGDVVLKFNHRKVTDSESLRFRVAETRPGTRVPVEVWRNGSTRTLEVKIGTLGGTAQIAQNNTNENNETGTLNGVGVTDLNPQTRQQFHVPATVRGALITEVKPGSPSAEAGLKPGDVIEGINRHAVKNAEDAVRLTEHARSKQTLLRLWADGGSHYVVVDESNHTG
jgi:serine protease Do